MWFRTGTASPSVSIADLARRALAVAATLAGLGACSGAAKADSRLDRFQGHIAFGYGKLFAETAPGGSISFAGGVEYPVRPQWSAGMEIGYWLLGTTLVDRGSFGAQLDYSVFEASAIARWTSARRPLQLYVGPGAFHALADLTTSAPAGF